LFAPECQAAVGVVSSFSAIVLPEIVAVTGERASARFFDLGDYDA
jgi:hypothetical protein